MTFTVTYRDRTGVKREETIDAASRAECAVECRRRGITPLGIRECLKAKQAASRDTKALNGLKGNSRRKQFLAVLGTLVFLAILGGGAWRWLSRPSRTDVIPPEKPASKAMPKEVAPTNPSIHAKISKNPISHMSPETGIPSESIAPKPRHYINPRRFPPTNQIFKTGLEQRIAHIFSTTPGMPPLPLPPLSVKDRKHIMEILNANHSVTEADSEEIAVLKGTVAQVKKEMARYLADGGDPDDFIRFYHNELSKCANQRREAIKMGHKIKKESPDLYDDYVKQVNETLRADGIKEIPLELDETD